MDSDVSISTLDHPWQGSAASPRVSAAPAAPSRKGGAYAPNLQGSPIAQQTIGRASRATSFLPKLTALILSAVLHTALALGAMQWTFTADSTRAEPRFRQGETQVMIVRLTLAPPSSTFTESKAKTATEAEPAAAPPPLAASQAPQPQPPAPPTDFTGNPTPAHPDKEQPGDAPGLSANPKNTLATTEPVEQPDELTTAQPDERNEEPVRQSVADPAAPPPPVPTDPPKAKPTETPPVTTSQPAVEASVGPTARSDVPAQPTNPKTNALARAAPKPREASIPESVPVPPAPPASAAKPQAADAASSAPAATPGVTRGIAIVELPEPRYPMLSIRAGEEGAVILEIEVLPDGSVGEVRVFASPGFARLERAAIDAIKRSRFEPATRGGKPVRDRITKEFRFVLKDARGR